ncbi:Protein kinase [Vigna unguiculata]|uniref:Protein kinase n=1 Tax=Vigna unguiculata TaxID=3917 RepID=A0A4D6LNJ2_VIGUN|nr:Protein kinase [Vigna unguiculata]
MFGSMLSFHFLLSCFMLLVLVAANWEPQDDCPSSPQPCGYLGKIFFPFTTSSNPKCGLRISGCEDDGAVKQISLGGKKLYKIDAIINPLDLNYLSIFIHYPDLDTVATEQQRIQPSEIENEYFTIANNITFFGCSLNPNEITNSIPSNMTLYRHCQNHSMYYNSSHSFDYPMPNIPFACLLFPFNFEGQRLNCDGQPPRLSQPPVPPPATAKAKKIALFVGIPILVVVFALVVVIILLLLKGRKKRSGLQSKSRSAYSSSFRNTTSMESGGVYFGISVFSFDELREATNNFVEDRKLGEGGFGIVYFGKLRDGREVAVKRLFERNYRPVESFINEIQILTRLRHRNLVSLYGCTSRHSRDLMLVYEHIPNGTVSSHLHGDQRNSSFLPWHLRMKIAIQTASALAYLHASDIIHRDVKTTNILLDNSFDAKVTDFGLSRLFPDDVTHVSTAPRGTPGYVDPDYRLCYQLTTKSDVYSFGVVLVELISSLKAVDMDRNREDIKLANLAIRKIQKGAFYELVDPSLGFHSDEKLKMMIGSVAELAFRCLQEDKELRPSMGEVLEVLERIHSGRDEPPNQDGIVVNGAIRASQSYVHPPLPNTLINPQQRLFKTN